MTPGAKAFLIELGIDVENAIVLTQDAVIDPNGHRLYLGGPCTTVGEALDKYIESLEVQCKFWRQAAEHAVKGWNALEEKVEAAHEALNALESNVDAARELLGGLDEWAPPEPAIPAVFDELPRTERYTDSKLCIVETETPRPKKA